MNILLRALACDLRSLALFRISLAVATTHLGTALAQAPHGTALGGSASVALCILALLLGFGYRTRFMTLATWLLLSALLLPGSPDPSEGERLLIALLFLGIWAPLGARYSVDAAMTVRPAVEERITSPAGAALLVQVTLVFFLSALAIGGGDEPTPGSQELLRLAGLSAPMLIFIPLPRDIGRLLLVIAVLAVAAIGMVIGSIPLEAPVLLALTAIVPSIVWDLLGRCARFLHRDGLRIYYDQDCGFCKKICLLFRTFLFLGETPVLPAQSSPRVYAVMREANSWVVYDHDGRQYLRWAAVLLLLRRSVLLWPVGQLLTLLRMGVWGDILYEGIASTRGRLSKLTAVLLPQHETQSLGAWPSRLIAISWLIAAALYNSAPTSDDGLERMRKAAHTFGLRQDWSLFDRAGQSAAETSSLPGRSMTVMTPGRSWRYQ